MNSDGMKTAKLEETDLVTELGWLGAGAVLPLTSISFYDRAVRRPPLMALIFFLAFGLVVGMLTAVGVTRDLGSLEGEVRQALIESEFPTITIADGIASANVPQPYTILDQDDTVLMIDTTGEVTSLNASRYDQGILLTQTELHILNQGGDYQITDLDDLNLLFGQDPLIINADTLSEFAGGFASVFSVIAFIVLLLWHVLVRLALVSFMALIIWALASTYWKGVKYSQVWIVGAYASIAALYLTYLLSRLSISICAVQFFLLAGIMLVVTYVLRPAGEEEGPRTFKPLMLQYAWVGLPLILVLSYDLINSLPYQGMIQMGVMIGVVAVLAAVEYFINPDSTLTE